MFRRSLRFALSCTAALAFLAGAALAESPEELLNRVGAKAKSLKSYEYTMTSTTKSSAMQMESKGTNCCVREGDTVMMRMEMTNTMTIQGMPPQETASVTVSDGKTMWTEMRQGGQTMVMKKAVAKPTDDTAAMKDMLKTGTAKILPSEEISGKKCAVLEITAKPEQEGAPSAVSTYWFAEDCGTMMKMEVKSGDTTTTMLVTELKVDPAIDKSKFSYTPPEGAVVSEM